MLEPSVEIDSGQLIAATIMLLVGSALCVIGDGQDDLLRTAGCQQGGDLVAAIVAVAPGVPAHVGHAIQITIGIIAVDHLAAGAVGDAVQHTCAGN